MKNVNRFHLS